MNKLINGFLLVLLFSIGCDSEQEDENIERDNTVSTDSNSRVEAQTDTETPLHPLQTITIRPSTTISTVAIIEWPEGLGDVPLESIQEAYVEFVLIGTDRKQRVPIRLDKENFKTVVVGMKAGELTYIIQTTIDAEGTTYTSKTHEFLTGYAPIALPTVEEAYRHEALPVEDGYIMSGGFEGGGGYNFIIDTEGDYVWWFKSPSQGDSSVTGSPDFYLDWEGNYFYSISVNPAGTPGKIGRVSLDGEESTSFDAIRAHHSLTPVPEGGVAFVTKTVDEKGKDTCDAIMHLDEGGAISEIFNLSDLIQVTAGCHVNYVGYEQATDSFYLSTRNYDIAAYASRDGVLKWAIGRDTYETASSSEDFEYGEINDIVALHGLHAWNGGKNVLLFNNTSDSTSGIYEYQFNDDSFGHAEVVWYYEREGAGSVELGGVQRLPEGNTQITYSTDSIINQVAASGVVVHKLAFSAPIGYGNWRKSLYGPPFQL